MDVRSLIYATQSHGAEVNGDLGPFLRVHRAHVLSLFIFKLSLVISKKIHEALIAACHTSSAEAVSDLIIYLLFSLVTYSVHAPHSDSIELLINSLPH